MQKLSIAASYIEKQRNFRSLVKDIQFSLTSKDYKQKGLSFNKYIKMRWNISQAQAYRYLMCAKVLDQLEEFEIQPSYERICNALYHTVKTPSQMKLLWSVILQKAGNVPESINSTHIKKIWKEICQNEKYSYICQGDVSLTKKVENSINKFNNEKKHKQLSQMGQMNQPQIVQQMNNNTVIPFSKIPSPVLSESSVSPNKIEQKPTTTINTINNIYTTKMNGVNIPLTPKNNFACNTINFENNTSYSTYDSVAIPQNNAPNNLYYVMSPNEIQLKSQQPNEIQYQQQSNEIQLQSQQPNEMQYQPQQIFYYY